MVLLVSRTGAAERPELSVLGLTGWLVALFPAPSTFEIAEEGLVVVGPDRAPRRAGRRLGRSGPGAAAGASARAPELVTAVDGPEHGVQQRREEQQPHHDPDHLSRLSLGA
jgi:hypothetical protein